MNLKEIKEIINLMNENNLGEIEIEREGSKIRIKKSVSGKFEAITEEGTQRMVQQVVSEQKEAPSKETSQSKNLVAIKAPMVGTFYRAPSPDSKPYIKTGDNIDIGQTICIIEAMKLMNEIKSEVKGKVVEILIENAEPVEYGQTLFMIEP